MNKYVYVVTNPELGWDCVVGVYDCDATSHCELRRCFPEDQYVIHKHLILENVDE